MKTTLTKGRTRIERIHASRLIRGGFVCTEPVVLTLGSFDGIHLGHQQILASLDTAAGRYPGCKKVFLTFYPHPSVALKKIPALSVITNLFQRLSFLSAKNIDILAPVFFSYAVQQMEWQDFLVSLTRIFQLKEVVIGEDARIGRAARGTAPLIKEFLEQRGVQVTILPLLLEGDHKYGSRIIREHIMRGEVAEAASELGRPYTVVGKVRKGSQLGRTIDFPTANVHYKNAVLPPVGVYAVSVMTEQGRWIGAANLGERPSVSKSHEVRLEVHLIGFQGDLYGQRIAVEFLEKIRDHKTFPDLQALKAQIAQDVSSIQQRYRP